MYVYYTLTHLFDPTPDYKAALKRCGHTPYAAEEVGELGSHQYELVYDPPSNQHFLSFDGYYCSQADAIKSGLDITSVNGQPAPSVTPFTE